MEQEAVPSVSAWGLLVLELFYTATAVSLTFHEQNYRNSWSGTLLCQKESAAQFT